MRNCSSAEKREAEEIASREKCLDFETFKPLFEQVQIDLERGLRTTRPFVKDAGFLKADVQAGQFFILGGQTAYVAEVGDDTVLVFGSASAKDLQAIIDALTAAPVAGPAAK